MINTGKILVLGYGNTSRQDDGVANGLINRLNKIIEKEKIKGVELLSNAQLYMEDALVISEKDIVIFVDASIEEIDDILFTKVEADSPGSGFTFHNVSPGFILNLCHKLYNKYPEVYLLHIKGYEWEIKECLSKNAEANLKKALSLLYAIIKNPDNIQNYLS
ncbi:hydrogenase maturation protease [Bacteroidota bacterium]